MTEQRQNAIGEQNRGWFDGKRVVILEEGDYETLLKMAKLSESSWAIGRLILRKRRNLGVSQRQLASRAGVRPETIHRIEKGTTNPGPDTLSRIERALREFDTECADRVRLGASLRENRLRDAINEVNKGRGVPPCDLPRTRT